LWSTGFPHVCHVVGEHVHSSHVGHAHECLAAVSGSISSSMASSEIASARWNAGSAFAGCDHPSPTRNAARSSTQYACPSSSVDLDM
jgi:hypothetical protein